VHKFIYFALFNTSQIKQKILSKNISCVKECTFYENKCIYYQFVNKMTTFYELVRSKFKLTRWLGCIASTRSKNARWSLRNCFAVSAGLVKIPANKSRAHWIVCWISYGKFFKVQIGISFSGGSCDELENALLKKLFMTEFYLYDSVRWGKTTWVFPLGPKVPDSSKGNW
jgi:hypothetical protein